MYQTCKSVASISHSLYVSRSTDFSFVQEMNKVGEHVWKARNNDCI